MCNMKAVRSLGSCGSLISSCMVLRICSHSDNSWEYCYTDGHRGENVSDSIVYTVYTCIVLSV